MNLKSVKLNKRSHSEHPSQPLHKGGGGGEDIPRDKADQCVGLGRVQGDRLLCLKVKEALRLRKVLDASLIHRPRTVRFK